MPLSLRLIILMGALLIFVTILRYIRKKKILMADASGWVCTAFLLVFIALFPGIVIRISGWLGFQSPANLVFFAVTGLLTVKTFRDSARISLLRHKLEVLTQEVALSIDEAKEANGQQD